MHFLVITPSVVSGRSRKQFSCFPYFFCIFFSTSNIMNFDIHMVTVSSVLLFIFVFSSTSLIKIETTYYLIFSPHLTLLFDFLVPSGHAFWFSCHISPKFFILMSLPGSHRCLLSTLRRFPFLYQPAESVLCIFRYLLWISLLHKLFNKRFWRKNYQNGWCSVTNESNALVSPTAIVCF